MKNTGKTEILRYFPISLFFAVFLLIFSFSANASNITKDFPPSIEPQVIIPVGFNITTDAGSSVTIVETIPAGAQITNWSVTGAENLNSVSPKIEASLGGTTYTWRFTASNSNPTLKYDVKPLSSTASSAISSEIFETDTSYTLSDKSGAITSKLVVINKPFDQMSAEAQQLLLSQQKEPETEITDITPEKIAADEKTQKTSSSTSGKTSLDVNVSDNTLTWFMVLAIIAVILAAGFVIYATRKPSSKNEPPSFS